MEISIFGREFHFFSDSGQWKKLQEILEKYLWNNWMTKVSIVLLLVIGILLIYEKKIQKNKRYHRKINTLIIKRLHFAQLGMYCLILLCLLVLNRETKARNIIFFRWSLLLTENGYHETSALLLLAYLFLWIPFGYLLRRMQPNKKICLIAVETLCSAASIEILQFLLARGTLSTGDLLVYVVGAMIGVALQMALAAKKDKKQYSEKL